MDYTLPSTFTVDIEKLQINLSGMPITGVSQSNGSIILHTSSELTVEQLYQAEQALALLSEFNPTSQTVSPRQMRVALITNGISLQDIEDVLNSLTEPQQSIARVTWEYSIEFNRNNPILTGLAPMLGLTEQQVDDLFILASTL